ncbi:MAG TPA: Ig-like domain-containing protein, partial [Rudaea sp.]|nr:Ig-like domain-containing protein [Rudaea sp.]
STVSFIGAGTCVIDANQAGDANYNAAPQVQQSFAVGKGNQTISFTSTAPVGAAVGGPTYTVAATATSGLPVTLSIDASAASVCSLAGSTVSLIGAGTCVIDANQAGNANYNAAPQVQQTFAVAKGNQTISFTSTAPVSAQFNGATYTVAATATSGLAVTFTIDASATSVCAIAGSTVSFIGAGTCVIDANQAGDANYNAAPQAQQSFAVAKADQTISFTSTPPSPALVNGNYTVSATASSGLAVTFSAGAPLVCAVAGSTVTFVGAGTCIVNADQAGNGSYNAAPQAQQSFIVNRNDQTITFSSSPSNPKVGGGTYTVTATASSGLTVTFSSGSAACTVVGSTVTFVHANTCTINADQAGNTAYNPAPQVQQSFLVAKGDQTINVTSTAPTYGSATAAATPHTYTVVATATSGLPIVVSIDATSTAGACSAVSPTVTFGASAGTCVIDIGQPGNADWNAATSVQQSTSVLVPPSAGNDSDTATGNVQISVAANGVLGNDTGTNISITAFDATSANGGTVVVNADGSYSYDPPANFTGSDTFTYTIDNALNQPSTGTVTITVSDRVMVVASGATGNCKPATPCAMSTADAAAAPTGKDLVYVESGSYSNPNAAIALNAGQNLVGQAVSLSQALTDASITLATDSVTAPITAIGANTTPTLSNNANVITLGGGNLVEYFSITNSAGAAIFGNAVTTGATVHDIAITGTGAALGVNITGNSTGSTFNFSNLAIVTAAGNAFSAVGPGPGAATGGTVNVTTGSNPNTLTSTTGMALNVSNTTIGASGMTFRSISAGTVASGPSKGIVLNNTGNTSGLTVSGTGSAGSGGVIQKASGNGVELISTKAPSLSWMNITNNTGSGIRGDSINGGLALSNLSVTNSSTKTSNCVTPSDTVNCQAVIFLYNLLGTGNTISNSTVSGGFEDNLHVESDGSNVLGGLTVSGSTIADNNSATGNDGLQIISRTNANMTITANGNTFHGNRATSIMANAGDASSINVTLTSNSIYNAGGANQGNIGIDVNGAITSNLTFNVSNNVIGKNGATAAPLMNTGINVFFNSAVNGGSVTGNVSNNIVHNAGYTFAGSGIRLFPANGNSVWKVRVDGNTVDNVGQDYGIFVGAGEQSGTGADVVQAGVLNNTVSVLGVSGPNFGALDAIRVQARVNGSMCARISGNNATPGASTGFFGIYTRQANAATYNLEGGTGGLAGNNPATAAASIGTAGTINTVAAGFCSQIP